MLQATTVQRLALSARRVIVLWFSGHFTTSVCQWRLLSRFSSNYRWELLSNQIWQGLNFFSKAAFLALLTPLMLEAWGRDGYGMFALASSLLPGYRLRFWIAASEA